ncbi:MAG: hypothetical protein IMZ55_11650 [Acidobacteria bacterium]|nr:hypothetical protein [Acidobacteriota bacterium]
MKTLVRLAVIVLAGAAVAAGLIHFRVGGADARWRQVCDWVAGRQAAGDPTGLLASFEGAVAQLRREAADAEARLKTFRDQAAAVTDAALEKLTAEEQQRVQVFRRKVDAAAAELAALEKEVRTAGASAGDDLRDRVAAALERRRVLARAERESRDRAAAEVQREIRRRTLLFGALAASEKAVFRGLPDTSTFDEKWEAAVRKQLEAHGVPGDQIPSQVERRRREALRGLAGGPS